MRDKNIGSSVNLAILRSIALSTSILLGTTAGYGGSYYVFSVLISASRLFVSWIDQALKLAILFTLLAILGLLGILVIFVRKNAPVLRAAFFEFHRFPTLTVKQMLCVFTMMIFVGAIIYLSLALYVRLLFMP
jgi:hypothetical protein